MFTTEIRLEQTDAAAGAILGCAVGDAIGLPYEAHSKRRGIRHLGEPSRHRFIFGRGMVSDDTEHTCMVAQAFCACPNDPKGFARELGRRLRWWLLGVPAGIGSATLRATLKLWLGFSPSRSGVFSAGNGPAMRSAVLGALIDDIEKLRLFVQAGTRITHTDPKAYYGALAVALAAWCTKRGLNSPTEFFTKYRELGPDHTSKEFDTLLMKIEASVLASESTELFAEQLGCRRGVSGYVYRTVPVVLHCWLSHPRDYRSAVTTMIRCGGDTDTTAAIMGAISGSGLGRSEIPKEWLDGLWEWPRSVSWMKRLAETADQAARSESPVRPPSVVPLIGFARNAVFLAAVLVHVVRRLLPPY
jgi:ADP-ribosylglycohydrolase